MASAGFSLAAVPSELHWLNQPISWETPAPDRLSITAGAITDWFNNPATTTNQDNAPSALFTVPDGSFLLSAKVTVDFASTFDAGVLQLYSTNDVWAKLCFEYSPQGRPMVVSVVTRGRSDDCNSVVIDGNSIYYRVGRNGSALFFHYSHDGHYWNLVRHFSLGQVDNLQAGFSAQSPTGQSCRAVFSEIHYRAGVIDNIRSGE